MMKKTLSFLLIVALLLCCAAAIPAQADSVKMPLVGDVSGDNSIESDDTTFLQRHLAEMALPFEFNESTADADEDGVVTIMDATHLQRWLVDMDEDLNIGDYVYQWFDESTAIQADSDLSVEEDLVINRICQNYFYASPYFPFPAEYKIYGKLSKDWHVGDHVVCGMNILYYDETGYYYEGNLLTIRLSTFVPDPYVCYKPVIYLYPEQETEVSVKLDLDGTLTDTYPVYNDGWTVTASPDGTLTDQSGKTYPYLFWEGTLNTTYDFSQGFCVKGEDTEDFLRESLAKLGLNDNEADEFIEFWLPMIEKDPYNVIAFQTDAYTDAAELNISPQPDTVIRVFMTWYSSDEAVEIPAQELTAPARSGFTAVEWGGSMVR